LLRFTQVLLLLMNHCADAIDARRFVLPDEEHAYYRAIPHLFYLLDSDDKKSGINAFKYKGLAIERFQKLFKPFPVIPLYGDMQISVIYGELTRSHSLPCFNISVVLDCAKLFGGICALQCSSAASTGRTT
jgi:hypothetical protein